MCSHQNRLIEASLMSTHNIPFSIKNDNYPKFTGMRFFSRDSSMSSKESW